MGGVYSDHIEYDFPQYDGDKSDPISLQRYLANMTENIENYARYQIFHAISGDSNPTTVHFMFFFIMGWKQPKFSTDCHTFSMKSYSSTLVILLLYHGLRKQLWVYGIRKVAPSPAQMSNILRNQWELFPRVKVS